MPRGKYVSHKGRCRQFTPSDQLQQELGLIMDKEQARDLSQGQGGLIIKLEQPEYDDPLDKISTRGVQNLIEEFQEKTKKDKTRAERRQKQGPPNSQTQADLDRLCIVRKEREAAAERRLAAKKAAAEADASRLMTSLKKLSKQCPIEEMKPPKCLVLRGK